jgi:hypothetical protein
MPDSGLHVPEEPWQGRSIKRRYCGTAVRSRRLNTLAASQQNRPLLPAGPDILEPGSGGGHNPQRRRPRGHVPAHELGHGCGQLCWARGAIGGAEPRDAAKADGGGVEVGGMEAEAEAQERRGS